MSLPLPSGQGVWFSVRGYPRGTPGQFWARRLGTGSLMRIFDLVLWHGEDASVTMALAFPD